MCWLRKPMYCMKYNESHGTRDKELGRVNLSLKILKMTGNRDALPLFIRPWKIRTISLCLSAVRKSETVEKYYIESRLKVLTDRDIHLPLEILPRLRTTSYAKSAPRSGCRPNHQYIDASKVIRNFGKPASGSGAAALNASQAPVPGNHKAVEGLPKIDGPKASGKGSLSRRQPPVPPLPPQKSLPPVPPLPPCIVKYPPPPPAGPQPDQLDVEFMKVAKDSVKAASTVSDVAVIHASETQVVDYLADFFEQMNPRRENSHKISVKACCVASVAAEGRGRSKGVLKAAENAHVQLVLVSASFIRCCGDALVCKRLREILEPQRVLCLLLGEADEAKLKAPQLAGLGSPSTWRSIRFETINLDSISELLEEMVKVLDFLAAPPLPPSSFSTSSLQRQGRGRKLRNQEQGKFHVIPSQLSWKQTSLTVLFETEVGHEKGVKIRLESEHGIYAHAESLHLLNPYAVSFEIPDSVRLTSGKLSVTVSLFDVCLGSCKVRVETRIDNLKAILESFTYPLEVMSLTMGVSSTRGNLDDHLSELLKGRVPPSSFGPRVSLKTGLEYPSWAHFSAAHGLDALTWTLLDLPGGDAVLTIPNCRGLTPRDLALANGFFSLGQDLQKAEFLTGLDAMVDGDPLGKHDDFVKLHQADEKPPYRSSSPRPILYPQPSSSPGLQSLSSLEPDSPFYGNGRPGSSVAFVYPSTSPAKERGDRSGDKLSPSPCWSPDAQGSQDVASLLSAWRARTSDTRTFLRSHHALIRHARRAVAADVAKGRVGNPSRQSPFRGERALGTTDSTTKTPVGGGIYPNLIEQFWNALEACRQETAPRPEQYSDGSQEDQAQKSHRDDHLPNTFRLETSPEPKKRSPRPPPRPDTNYLSNSEIHSPTNAQIITERIKVRSIVKKSSSFCLLKPKKSSSYSMLNLSDKG
ncbi:uncharacterized protein LOC119576471 [Penaeus monodon]|uniref:uncharacterized protein LOC119576471 n=1 Tax=Penaeus monodon TaxID=6687 RepID=UPI0018A71416|nr:uncharacterized protein LOC119576471 [Penaeus monodon]